MIGQTEILGNLNSLYDEVLSNGKGLASMRKHCLLYSLLPDQARRSKSFLLIGCPIAEFVPKVPVMDL